MNAGEGGENASDLEQVEEKEQHKEDGEPEEAVGKDHTDGDTKQNPEVVGGVEECLEVDKAKSVVEELDSTKDLGNTKSLESEVLEDLFSDKPLDSNNSAS